MIDDVEILTVGRRHISDGVSAAGAVWGVGDLVQNARFAIYFEYADLSGVLLGRRDVKKVDCIAGSACSNTESKTKGYRRDQGNPAEFTMQHQGCMTSMAWLPWVMAALQVGCPVALKGVFCTGASAPVEGFRLRPDTVLPRKFTV